MTVQRNGETVGGAAAGSVSAPQPGHSAQVEECMTEKEIEERLAKTIEPPDGGNVFADIYIFWQTLWLVNCNRVAILIRAKV